MQNTIGRPRLLGSVSGRRTAVGVAGAILAFLGAALFAALTLPWRGTIDATWHLDYLYQLQDGHLPAPYGLEFLAPGVSPGEDRQYASAHPPLYYLLVLGLVPRFGPADWIGVVVVGRLLNVVLGAATVVLIGWAGWTLGGRHRHRLAIGAAATGTLTVSFVRFAGEIYNDILLAALSTAALVVTMRTLRHGPTWARMLALAALCGAGMLTKATFVVVLVLCLGGVGLAALVHAAGTPGRRVAVAVTRVLPVLAVPVMSAGWFYLRNWELSGSWFRSTPRVPTAGRPYRTAADSLTDPAYYLIVPERLLGQDEIPAAPLTNYGFSLVLCGVAALLALLAVYGMRRRWQPTRHSAVPRTGALLAALLPVGVLLGMYAVQLNHAIGYGNYNIRYFLPASVTIGLLFALAGLAVGRGAALVVPAAMVVMLAATVHYSAHLAHRFGGGAGEVGDLAAVLAAAAQNDVPGWAVWACLAVAVAGTVVVALSLWHSPDQSPVGDQAGDEPADGAHASDGETPQEPLGRRSPGH